MKNFLEYVPESFLEYIKIHMDSFQCPTHDFNHCIRVTTLALRIAQCETSSNLRLVVVAALSHDILDSKLVDSNLVLDKSEVLRNQILSFESEEFCDRVFEIIHKIGYKYISRGEVDPRLCSLEHRCVQDADLLDAIGCVGIARCFGYCGKKNQDLLFVDQKWSMESAASTYAKGNTEGGVQHFFNKLLNLQRHISTQEGGRLASLRQERMKSFLAGIAEELMDCGYEQDSLLVSERIRQF